MSWRASTHAWLQRCWAALWLLLAAWLLWQLMDWAWWQAVFQPDLAACQALAHQGACWGVVAVKGTSWFLGERSSTGHLTGLPLTLWLTAVTWLCSFPLALLLAWGRLSPRPWLSALCTAWIETWRGAPLVMWLFAAAFVLPAASTPVLAALDMSHWEPDIVTRVAVVMTLFSAAYMAEIFRGSLRALPAEQVQVAQTLGASWFKAQRLVVLPQALRSAIPALTGHTIGLLKDTSLVTIVSLQDLTGAMSMSLNGDADWRPFFFEAYLFIALVYACLCLGLSALGRQLEKRYPAMGQAQ